MYLNKVEIAGFKSFANKTTLNFFPDKDCEALAGITAIVGPNGSGKSNVADAIRWALGEQSSKNLRGKKAEDVIFAGTDKKSKLGAASVTLFFDNKDSRIPIEFSDVAITRKVYRSGESEYLINGSKVRLMDVSDMLAKAGIGKDSYCVITQGMSDALLRATPLERKSIIEDAAGVKQFQIEKERSRRKLEATEDNLRQVDALLVELTPHLKNLRRQAEKMKASKQTASVLKTKQELLYGYLWQTFQKERGDLALEKEQAEKEISDLESSLQQKQQTVEGLNKELETGMDEDALRKKMNEIQAELNHNRQTFALLEGKIELEKEKQKVEEVIRLIPVDLAYVGGALEEVQESQKNLIARLKEISSLDDVPALKLEAENIYQKIQRLKEKAGQGKVEEKTVIQLPAEEMKASLERIKSYEAEKKALQDNWEERSQELQSLEAELLDSRQKEKETRASFLETEKAWREEERLFMEKKDKLSDLRVRLARVEVREEDLINLVREELSVKPDDLPKVTETVEREKLEREITRLKVEIEHVGSLDPLVIEEFTETEERTQFLEHESRDLREAIRSLEEVIKEMDKKIETAFQDAYKDIRKKFIHYFDLIFGGGKADMTLEEIKRKSDFSGSEDDGVNTEPKEMGVEISACPPGKKITSLAMLSGGERSLTSLAFLFAVIAHNPPPFAVLDEVEAALDEANSQRFGNLLRELSTQTQFVAITHNRETMRQAHLLYGVTMGGDGVSQLLSMKLETALSK